MKVSAVVFDLDGVIVSTDHYHYLAWKRLAEEENIPYSIEVNQLQRGVSRMESLDIMLQNTNKPYTEKQKALMAERKNQYYITYIQKISPTDILEGVTDFLNELKQRNIQCAVASSSKNTAAILKGIGLDTFFDAVADGTQITNSKPDPEVFSLAANLLNLPPEACIAIEDAEAGIESAKAAGMTCIGIGAGVWQ